MLNLHDLRLADVMTVSPLSFTLDTPVTEACRALINERVLAAPVFDEGSEEVLEVSVAAARSDRRASAPSGGRGRGAARIEGR